MKITPSSLNHRAVFGSIKSVTNENTGGQQRKFIPAFKLWCAYRTRTLNQMFSAKEAGMIDTRTIAVRSNSNINEMLCVQLDDGLYKIDNISPDNSNRYISFDFVILSKIEKVGE